MIRLGLYDAYDKWDILCRYWLDPTSLTEPILEKHSRPALPEWEDLALAGGRYACDHYIELKLNSLRSGMTFEANDTTPEGQLAKEIADCAGRLGRGGLRELVHKLGPAIVAGGFGAPFDATLSPALTDRLRDIFKAGAIGLLRWADMPGEIPSIDVMRTRYNAFPVNALKHKRNVLSLFCAFNYGRSDVIHIHEICPDHVTLVDINAECLNDMQQIYPKHWTYVCADFREFLEKQATEQATTYDLVVADPFLGLVTEVAWDLLPIIMSLCTDTFITNYTAEMLRELDVDPEDLEAVSNAVRAKTGVDVTFRQLMARNTEVYWAVMQRRTSPPSAARVDHPG